MTAIPITLEPDAFARLSSARTSESESWSDVVRRAVWSDALPARRGADILDYMKTRTEFLDDKALDLIEAADRGGDKNKATGDSILQENRKTGFTGQNPFLFSCESCG